VWGDVFPSPPGDGFGEREEFFDLYVKISTSGAFWALFSAIQLAVVHAKNTALGLEELAAVCKQPAKSGKASLLETINDTIGPSVVSCVIAKGWNRIVI